jgi:hypothetical protein
VSIPKREEAKPKPARMIKINWFFLQIIFLSKLKKELSENF